MRLHTPRTVFVLLAALTAITTTGNAQTVWSGFDVAFDKPDFTDPQDPIFQDRITDAVWITRGIDQGIYNIQQEAGYTDTSPADTQWAFAGINFNPDEVSAEGFAELNFADWATSLGAQGGLAENILVKPGVVHLISEDIYIDIMFTAWTTRGDGGGFAYLRGGPAAEPTPIQGTVFEAALDVGVCRNLTTGERTVLPAIGGMAEWDCSAAGFAAAPDDSVLVVLRGRAMCEAGEGCAVGGSGSGLDLRAVRCTNLVDPQVAAPIPMGSDFDCASADFMIESGQALQLILFGGATP